MCAIPTKMVHISKKVSGMKFPLYGIDSKVPIFKRSPFDLPMLPKQRKEKNHEKSKGV